MAINLLDENKYIKCPNGIDTVFKRLDKNGTSITIICNNNEATTPHTINQLFLRGTLKADLLSLLQLNTCIF